MLRYLVNDMLFSVCSILYCKAQSGKKILTSLLKFEPFHKEMDTISSACDTATKPIIIIV